MSPGCYRGTSKHFWRHFAQGRRQCVPSQDVAFVKSCVCSGIACNFAGSVSPRCNSCCGQQCERRQSYERSDSVFHRCCCCSWSLHACTAVSHHSAHRDLPASRRLLSDNSRPGCLVGRLRTHLRPLQSVRTSLGIVPRLADLDARSSQSASLHFDPVFRVACAVAFAAAAALSRGFGSDMSRLRLDSDLVPRAMA